MQGLTKFFTFIFEKGKQTEKVKTKIAAYMNANNIDGLDPRSKEVIAKFSKYIYKKNGEYREGGR